MSEEKTLIEEVASTLISDEGRYTIVYLDHEGEQTYEIQTELINPFELDLGRFLPNKDPMSLPRFYEIAAELIANAQFREGKKETVSLVEQFPPEELAKFGDEVISYRLIRRSPGSNTPSGSGRIQRKSRYSYSANLASQPSKVIIVESRPLDHEIEFTCWAKSNKLASERALWLEKLFINHAWAFQVQGVERFLFQQRLADNFTNISGQRLFSRPLRFFVRFHEFEVKAHPKIKQFNIMGSLN